MGKFIEKIEVLKSGGGASWPTPSFNSQTFTPSHNTLSLKKKASKTPKLQSKKCIQVFIIRFGIHIVGGYYLNEANESIISGEFQV